MDKYHIGRRHVQVITAARSKAGLVGEQMTMSVGPDAAVENVVALFEKRVGQLMQAADAGTTKHSAALEQSLKTVEKGNRELDLMLASSQLNNLMADLEGE